MFDDTDYKGLVSQSFYWADLPNKICTKDYNEKITIGSDINDFAHDFIYDMIYIKDFKKKFRGNDKIIDIIDTIKNNLILEFKQKYELVKDRAFNRDGGIPLIFKDELSRYMDVRFITFTDNYYIADSYNFTKLLVDPKQTIINISSELYFESFHDVYSENNLLKSLESIVGTNHIMSDLKLNNIYYVDSKYKMHPELYNLDINSFLFQLRYIKNTYMFKNIYFQFDNILIVPSKKESLQLELGLIYSNVCSNFVKDGTYFMPFIGNDKLYILDNDKKEM